MNDSTSTIAIPETGLRSRATLAEVIISQWTNSKLDKVISSEVTTAYNADSGTIRCSKELVPKDTLRAVKTAANAVYEHHISMTMPWSKGVRLLPNAVHQIYKTKLDDLIIAFEQAADAFCQDTYPDLLAAAPQRLGKAYNPADFVSVERIRSKFNIEYLLSPIPETKDIRLDLTDAEKRRLEKFYTSRAEMAIQDLYQRVYDKIKHLHERLTKVELSGKRKGKPVSLHASTVDAVSELADSLDDMNFSDDPLLTEISGKINAELAGIDAKDIKNNPEFRQQVANSAKGILDVMSFYIGTDAAA